jgi:hypothetical protein
VELAFLSCRFGSLAALTRDNVGRPVVLGSDGLVFAVMLFILLQEVGEYRDAQIIKPSARQPGCDFLKQPSIAVGITKRGERVVSGMLGLWTADATAAFDLELSARCSGWNTSVTSTPRATRSLRAAATSETIR